MSEELKPCPFCGSSNVIVEHAPPSVHCANPNCPNPARVIGDVSGDAILAWNRLTVVPEGWKSVREEWPLETDPILLSYFYQGRGPIVTCGYLAYTTDLGFAFIVEAVGVVEPTHWMPLPAAPDPQEGQE